MYKLGVRDAEQDDLNLFYYQHYYYYRQGYDQSRRGSHGIASSYRAWSKRLFPLVAAFLIVAVIVGGGWFVLRMFNGDSGTATNGTPPPSMGVGQSETDTSGESEDTTQPPTSPVIQTSAATTDAQNTPAIIPASTMRVGGLAQIVNVGDSPLRARSNPGLDHPIETSFSENVQVEILDGPVEADGYIWWQLAGEEGIGWCAESSPDGLTWLQPLQVAAQPTTSTRSTTQPTSTPRPSPSPTPTPSTPTPTPTPSEPYMYIGGMARVTNIGQLELTGRSEPGVDAEYQVGFLEGSEVTILDGPVRADGYIWWQVEYAGSSGWCAEGDPESGEMWLTPFFPLSDEDKAKTAAALTAATAEIEAETAEAEAAAETAEVAVVAETAEAEAAAETAEAEAAVETTEAAVALAESATATPSPSPTPTPSPTEEILPLHVGGTALVTNVGGAKLSARDEPGLDGVVVTQFLDGEEVVVLLGPIDADGYTWWRVEGENGVGWSAEKDPDEGTIWLMPQ
jgi:hypothetical protein